MPKATKLDEIFYDFNISHMLDLSVGCLDAPNLLCFPNPMALTSFPVPANPGDGKTAMAAIKAGATLVGITFNSEHTEMLYRRLEERCFQEFQNADSPLFESALVALLGGKKRKTKTVPKAKAKKAKTKNQAEDMNEEEEEEDEVDEYDEDDEDEAADGDNQDEEGEDEEDPDDERDEDFGVGVPFPKFHP